MSEGPGYYERPPRGGRPQPGRGRDDEDGGATFADVFNGFTFGSNRDRRQQEEQASSAAERSGYSGGGADEPSWSGHSADPENDDAAPAASIRPYAWTGGRTKSNVDLELETLVSTSEHYQPGMPLRHEHQSVAELCRHPRSAAEVGALLGVPFGVAKVLLADMAEQGLIHVHQTVTDSGSAPHLMLMERVLSGLRRL